MRKYLLVCFMLTLISVPCFGQKKKASLRHLLASQGFTGALDTDRHRDSDISFQRAGTFTCNGKALQVIYNEWNQTKPKGVFGHYALRLIFMDGSVYLGSYRVPDKPIFIRDGVIKFEYSADLGNEITCGDKGLPEKVLLYGEIDDLQK